MVVVDVVVVVIDGSVLVCCSWTCQFQSIRVRALMARGVMTEKGVSCSDCDDVSCNPLRRARPYRVTSSIGSLLSLS